MEKIMLHSGRIMKPLVTINTGDPKLDDKLRAKCVFEIVKSNLYPAYADGVFYDNGGYFL